MEGRWWQGELETKVVGSLSSSCYVAESTGARCCGLCVHTFASQLTIRLSPFRNEHHHFSHLLDELVRRALRLQLRRELHRRGHREVHVLQEQNRIESRRCERH